MLGHEGDVLLSDEALYIASSQNLEVLRNAAKALDIHVLVFFRPHPDRFVSGYLQALKAGKIGNESVDDYALRQHHAGLHNWLACADRLQQIFGQLRVRWYPAILRGRGIVAEAFDWLGVPPLSEVGWINPSPGREAAVVLQAAVPTGIVTRRFSDRFLQAAQQECGLGSRIYLREDVQRIIERETHEANVELLRRYCPDLSPDLELKPSPRRIAKEVDAKLVACLKGVASKIALELGNDPEKVRQAFGECLARGA
jgi:hypothetical protein